MEKIYLKQLEFKKLRKQFIKKKCWQNVEKNAYV